MKFKLTPVSVTGVALLCAAIAGVVQWRTDSDALSSAFLVAATIAYAGYTIALLRSAQDQAKASVVTADATASATGAAARAADAAALTAREAARSRVQAPMIAVLPFDRIEGPWLNTTLKRRPQGSEQRPWEAIHSMEEAAGEVFAPADRAGQLLWFMLKISVENIGAYPARLRLTGDARFVGGTAVPVGSPDRGEHVIGSGVKTTVEWWDGVDCGATEGGSMHLVIDVFDHAGAVHQSVPIELGVRPFTPSPGSSVMWRIRDDFAGRDGPWGVTVYPTTVWYAAEGGPLPELPWNSQT